MKGTDSSGISEEEFDSIRKQALEFAGIGLYRCLPDGAIVFMDKAAMKIFELDNEYPDPSDIEGKNIEDLIEHINPPGHIREMVKKYGSITNYEYSFKTRTGRKKWVLHNSYMVTGPSGEKAVQAAIRDITDHKQEREFLRENEISFRDLVDTMEEGLVKTDDRGVIIYVNDSSCRMLGYSKEDILGKTPDRFMDETTANKYRELLKARLEGARSSFKVELHQKSGARIPVISSGRPLYSEDGLFLGVVAVLTDISELDRIEAELAESEEMYRALVNASPDSITTTDLAGNITYASPQTAKLLKYDRPEDLIGRNAFDMVDPRDLEKAINSSSQTQHKGYDKNIEVRFVRRDGSRFFAELDTALIRDAQGKPKGMIANTKDVSSRKMAEEKLKESEQMFRIIAEQSVLALFIFQDGKIIYTNEALLDALKYSLEEVYAWTEEDIFNLVHPEDREFIREQARKKLAWDPDTVTSYTYRLYTKQGNLRWMVQHSRPIMYKGRTALLVSMADITDRKNAEEALKRSEAEKALVMDAVFEHLIYHDIDLKVIWANRAAAESVDLTVDDLIGKDCFRIWQGRDTPCHNCPVNRSIQSGETEEAEMFTPEGRAWYIRSYPVRDKNQRITGAVETTREITEKKKAEKELQESRSRLIAAIENLPFDFFMIGKDGRYTLANTTVRRHWAGVSSEEHGNGPEDIVGKKPEELGVDKEYMDIWLENNRRAFAGEVVKGEVTYCIEGEDRHFFNIISPVYYGDEIKEILGVNIDVTDRKRAEESLAEEKERLAVTLRSIGDGVISTDREGRIILMNRMAENLTGRRQEQALGKSLESVFHIIDENTGERAEDPVKKVLDTEGSINLSEQTILVGADGSERVIADSAAPIRDRESKVIGVVIVFRDVTQKRKLESELMRTEKLESIGILAGGIAHDFNNILTAILANISMSRMLVKDMPKLDSRLEEAEKACGRAKSLTRQLLTFTKGGTPLKSAISIKNLVRESCLFALHGSNVDCEFDFQEDIWPVEVDEGQISQVIHNLVINSDQAMPQGGTLHVKVENIELKEHTWLAPGPYTLTTVADEGVGIPQDYLEKIFDPFFTTKEKGSGLGLATSYSIVHQHDGHIEVCSQPGKGTIFTIYLPAVPQKQPQEKESVETPLTGKGRILVMDDDRAIRDLLNIMLSELGYEAKFAGDGEEAIKEYKKALHEKIPFDLVILDLTIPGKMGGKETMENLQKIDPHICAIVSSGYSTDDIMADYKSYGFKGVVNKPYDMKELSKVLKKVLDNSF